MTKHWCTWKATREDREQCEICKSIRLKKHLWPSIKKKTLLGYV